MKGLAGFIGFLVLVVMVPVLVVAGVYVSHHTNATPTVGHSK